MASLISQGLSSQKSRILLFVSIFAVFILLLVVYFNFRSSGSEVKKQGNLAVAASSGNAVSETANQASGISSNPGLGSTSESYAKLITKANVKGAQEAASKDESFVPTLVKEKKQNNAEIQNLLNQLGNKSGSGSTGSGAGNNNAENSSGANDSGADGSGADGSGNLTAAQRRAQKILQEQLNAQKKRLAEEAEAHRQAELAEKLQQEQQAYEQVLANQFSGMVKEWELPKQKYVAGGKTDAKLQAEAAAQLRKAKQLGMAAAKPAPIVFAKSGDVFYAVLITAVDSDQAGPVMARIISGRFKGAKAVGSMKLVNDRVQLSFNVLNIPGEDKSFAMNAIAIDPNTARSALATDVNHHYLLRYGSFFASTFISGYANALRQSNSTVVIPLAGGLFPGIGVQHQKLDKHELFLSALGNVGSRLSSSVNLLNKPVTVKISAGTAVALLLQQDLTNAAPDAGKSYDFYKSKANENNSQAKEMKSQRRFPTVEEYRDFFHTIESVKDK